MVPSSYTLIWIKVSFPGQKVSIYSAILWRHTWSTKNSDTCFFIENIARIAAGYCIPVVIHIEGNSEDHLSTSGLLHCQILDGGISNRLSFY